MAMYDWNNDGKKDYKDSYIDYKLSNGGTDRNNGGSYYSSGKGMFTLGAIISVIAGLVLQCVFYMIFGIDVENVPALVILILWVVFSAIAAVVVEKIGL